MNAPTIQLDSQHTNKPMRTSSFRFVRCCLSIATLAATTLAAHAVPITVENFSFERPTTLTFTESAAPGLNPLIMEDWIFAAPDGAAAYGVQVPGTLFDPGQVTGSQIGWVNSTSGIGTLTSAMSLATVQANTNYTLTVGLGNRNDSFGTNNGTFVLSILVDNVSQASITRAGSEITAGTFSDTSVFWNSGLVSAGDLTVQLGWQRNGVGDLAQGNFDNVRLNATAVPEPNTLLLLGLAGAVAIVSRRRSRR